MARVYECVAEKYKLMVSGSCLFAVVISLLLCVVKLQQQQTISDGRYSYTKSSHAILPVLFSLEELKLMLIHAKVIIGLGVV